MLSIYLSLCYSLCPSLSQIPSLFSTECVIHLKQNPSCNMALCFKADASLRPASAGLRSHLKTPFDSASGIFSTSLSSSCLFLVAFLFLLCSFLLLAANFYFFSLTPFGLFSPLFHATLTRSRPVRLFSWLTCVLLKMPHPASCLLVTPFLSSTHRDLP